MVETSGLNSALQWGPLGTFSGNVGNFVSPNLATSAICLLPTSVAAAGAGEMEFPQREKLPLFHQSSRLFFPLSPSSEIGSTRPECFHPFPQFWSFKFSRSVLVSAGEEELLSANFGRVGAPNFQTYFDPLIRL